MYFSSGELAKRFNVSVRTIRYYDQIGLVCPSKWGEGGKRYYSEEDCLVLEKVLLLKELSLPLEEINRIVKDQSIETILLAHKSSLEEKMVTIQQAIAHTNSLLHIHQLEGTLNWEDLLTLVVPAKPTNNWNLFFSNEEQGKLKERMPKLEDDHVSVKKWVKFVYKKKFLQIQKRPNLLSMT